MWEKIYIGYAVIVLVLILSFVVLHFKRNPKKDLNFIVQAHKDGRMTVAKMTCLTLEGTYKYSTYHAEYMYVVDGQRYFLTYEMVSHIAMDARKEEMNADMLLLKLKPALIVFYDKNNPKKVMSKLEVFTSREGINQIATPKKNVWRDTEKSWISAIDLRRDL